MDARVRTDYLNCAEILRCIDRYAVTLEGCRKLLAAGRYSRNLFAVDELLPAAINSTQYSEDRLPLRLSYRNLFQGLSLVNALTFPAAYSPVTSQWDHFNKGTQTVLTM